MIELLEFRLTDVVKSGSKEPAQSGSLSRLVDSLKKRNDTAAYRI
jgi:hypothetical protein